MVRPAPLNRPARIGAHRPRILFGWRPGLDYLTVSGYVGATVVEPAGALCMPGSRSDFLARDAQTGARSVPGRCLPGGPFGDTTAPGRRGPRFGPRVARAAQPSGWPGAEAPPSIGGASPRPASAGVLATRRGQARVGAVDGGLVAFAGGKHPGTHRSGVQPLRIIGPHTRQAVKSVGHPVFGLRDGRGRGRNLLPETHGRQPSTGRALVVDSVGVRHRSLLECAQLDARLPASVGPCVTER